MPQEPRPALAMWLQINLTALVVLMAGQWGNVAWPARTVLEAAERREVISEASRSEQLPTVVLGLFAHQWDRGLTCPW